MARARRRSPSDVGPAWRGQRRRLGLRHDRRARVAIRLTAAELEDWRLIAAAWRVPVATAMWATLAERLGVWRRRAPELGAVGLEIAATAAALGILARPSGAAGRCPLLTLEGQADEPGA